MPTVVTFVFIEEWYGVVLLALVAKILLPLNRDFGRGELIGWDEDFVAFLNNHFEYVSVMLGS